MKLSSWLRACAAIVFVCLAASAAAQDTTLTSAHIGGANPLPTGTIYVQPTSAARRGTSGGQILGVPYQGAVSAGIVSVTVADAYATSPAICYAITVLDQYGSTVLGNGLQPDGVHVVPGGPYGCVPVTGITFNFDTYVPPSFPIVLPQTGGSVNGPLAMNAGATVTGGLTADTVSLSTVAVGTSLPAGAPAGTSGALAFYAPGYAMNPMSVGAKCDVRGASDGVVSGGALGVLNSATRSCTSADVGKVVKASLLGPSGAGLSTTVAACSGSGFSLATPASQAATGSFFYVMTDDWLKLQAAYDVGNSVFIPRGACYSSRELYYHNGTRTYGDGVDVSGAAVDVANEPTILSGDTTYVFGPSGSNMNKVTFENVRIATIPDINPGEGGIDATGVSHFNLLSSIIVPMGAAYSTGIGLNLNVDGGALGCLYDLVTESMINGFGTDINLAHGCNKNRILHSRLPHGGVYGIHNSGAFNTFVDDSFENYPNNSTAIMDDISSFGNTLEEVYCDTGGTGSTCYNGLKSSDDTIRGFHSAGFSTPYQLGVNSLYDSTDGIGRCTGNRYGNPNPLVPVDLFCGDVNVAASRLQPQIFSDTTVTNGAVWSTTGDLAITGSGAVYTYGSGTSTLSYTVALEAGRWYYFAYTFAGVTGSPSCSVPNTTANLNNFLAATFPVVNGHNALFFMSSVTAPTTFSLTCTGAPGSSFTLNLVNLFMSTGGDINMNGWLKGAPTTNGWRVTPSGELQPQGNGTQNIGDATHGIGYIKGDATGTIKDFTIQERGITQIYSSSMTPDISNGNAIFIPVTNNSAYTINNPASVINPLVTAVTGQKMTIVISNNTAGTIASPIWGGQYVNTNAIVTPAAGARSSVTFTFDGVYWVGPEKKSAANADSATTATTATHLAGTGVNSAPYQSASGTTGYITAPTTNGHTFVYGWQPTGSSVPPTALDLAIVTPATPLISNVYPAGDTVCAKGKDSTVFLGGVLNTVTVTTGTDTSLPASGTWTTTGGGGTGATGTFTATAGNLATVTITSGGSGYTFNPTFVPNSGTMGTSTTAFSSCSNASDATGSAVAFATTYTITSLSTGSLYRIVATFLSKTSASPVGISDLELDYGATKVYANYGSIVQQASLSTGPERLSFALTAPTATKLMATAEGTMSTSSGALVNSVNSPTTVSSGSQVVTFKLFFAGNTAGNAVNIGSLAVYKDQ